LFDSFMAVRTIHFASVAMVAGLMPFLLIVCEPVLRRSAVRSPEAIVQLRRNFIALGWTMLVLSIVSGGAWLVLLAARLSGQSISEALQQDTVWTVVTETRFGEDWQVRSAIALLLALCIARFQPARGWRSRWDGVAATLLAACFIGSLAWAGHGGANPGRSGIIQAAADGIHLIGAGAWVGGLVPFALVMLRARRARDLEWNAVATEVTVRFSALGVIVVALLVLSGIVNSWFLVGSIPGLVGTYYGHLLLLKIGLFVVMISLAAINRLHLMPRLSDQQHDARTVLSQIYRNGLLEVGLGIAILGIVGVLGTIPPAAHTQALWPFAVRYTASALSDPASRLPAFATFAALTIGMMCLLGALLANRRRLALLATGVLFVAASLTGFRLFAIKAFPTSFYVSPTGFSAQSTAAGQKVFLQQCTSCHGLEGRGDGPAAKDLQPPPADLTAEHIYDHSDGDLFWWISHGIGDVMPAFGTTLDDTARWNLIDFIHANADAQRLQIFDPDATVAAGPSPNFSVECPDGSTTSLDELHGRIIHLVFAEPQSSARVRQLATAELGSDVTTIIASANADDSEGSTFCVAHDPEILAAFAIYRGSDDGQMTGTEFLIDSAGSLRSMWYPGLRPDWANISILKRRIEDIRRMPVASRSTMAHGHPH